MSLSNFSGVNHRKWTAAIYFPNLHWSKILCSVVSPFQVQSFCTERWCDMDTKMTCSRTADRRKKTFLWHIYWKSYYHQGVWPFGPMGKTGVRLCMRPMSAIQFPPEPHWGPVPHKADLYVTRTYITRTVDPKDSYNKRTLNSVNILPLPPSFFRPVILSHKRAQSIKEGG